MKVIDLVIDHKPTSNSIAIYSKSRYLFQQKISTVNNLVYKMITDNETKLPKGIKIHRRNDS